MESSYQGDLADVVRASGGIIGTTNTSSELKPPPSLPPASIWQLQFPSIQSVDDFGDPFSITGDPLLGDSLDPKPPPPPLVSAFLDSSSTGGIRGGVEDNNVFSRIQISPNSKFSCDSQMGLKAASISSPSNNDHSFQGCLVQSPPSTVGVQISSPRNTGIKRRKSQAKKVVCIPAPAPANSRSSGEVVPSDLWAWRKYGQKPIKGSPYPRGYYRCSSSKGCSARKQVERSRTDPNMLVITYTSEHNHPWPTQRNALAGSTRSSHQSRNSTTANPREKINSQNVKDEKASNAIEMINHDDVEGFQADDGGGGQAEDFFAELGDIEVDPLDLLFTQGEEQQRQQQQQHEYNPLSFFSWSTAGSNNNNNVNSTSFGETNKDT